MKIFLFISIFSVAISCTEKVDFDRITYNCGGFGLDEYNLVLNKDKSFTLQVGFNPLSMDSTKVGYYEGKITDEKMEEIRKGISKISEKDYKYDNPELALDAGIYEVKIIKGKTEKRYKTYNATGNFRKDIIYPLNEVCEKFEKSKIK